MRLCIVLVLVLLLAESDLVNWCQKYCDWIGMEHLRCSFKELKFNTLCPEIESSMTPEDRKFILHYHNVLRNDVAKGRKNWKAGSSYIKGWESYSSSVGDMRQLLWDDELEENARIYASQCNVRAHKPYQCAITENLPVVHMNKFDQSGSELTMQNAFARFVGHKKVIHLFFSDSLLIQNYIPGPWDDFFAVVFSQSLKLGCAKVICRCNQIKPLYESGSVVCIYGPSPNFSSGGFPIFASGKPCKLCPPKTSCNGGSRYKYLCAGEHDPEGPEDIPGRGCAEHQIYSTLLNFQVLLLMNSLINMW